MMLVLDLGFWIWHYLLHTPWLYRFHKVHHAVRNVSSWANDHEHPVETVGVVLVRLGVVAFFSRAMPLHPIVAFAFFAVTKWYAVVVHSGYNPPPWDFIERHRNWLWPIATPSWHEQHHYYNQGHFGMFTTIYDTLYDKHFGKKKNAR